MPSLDWYLRDLGQFGEVRDYTHASRTFVNNNFALHPKFSNLFHVVFNFAPASFRYFSNNDKVEMSLMVKRSDLPRYNLDVAERNQYNKHAYTQNRINYDPVTITFHDDNSDLIRKLWYAYYSFYYADPSNEYRDYEKSTYQFRPQQRWGFNNGNAQFFQDIRVYTMFQKRFAEYTLINPIITSFSHDSVSYDQGSTPLEHTMTLSYESVKYASGYVNGSTISTFGKLHYDSSPSPLTYDYLKDFTYEFGKGLVGVFDQRTVDLKDSVVPNSGGSGNTLTDFIYNNFRDTGKSVASRTAPVISWSNPDANAIGSTDFNFPRQQTELAKSTIATALGVNDPTYNQSTSTQQIVSSENEFIDNGEFNLFDTASTLSYATGGATGNYSSGTYTPAKSQTLNTTSTRSTSSQLDNTIQSIQTIINQDIATLKILDPELDASKIIKIQQRIDYNESRIDSLNSRQQ